MTGTLVIQNGNTHTATATPLLNVRGTMSGRSLYITGTGAQPLLTTTITRGRVGVGTASPDTTLDVVGTISGALLTINAGEDSSNYILGKVGLATSSPHTRAQVTIGTGAVATGPQYGLLVYRQSTTSNRGVGVSAHGGTTGGSGIGLYGLGTATTGESYGVFGTATATSGKSYAIYGRAGGTTAIDWAGYFVGTLSGSRIQASTTLTSSGGLVWEGAASGATLYVATSVQGAGLTDCDTPTTSKLLWDSSTGRFSCGSDQSVSSSFGTGNVLTIGDARYVKRSGDTMTGALVINVTGGVQSTLGLRVINTASGAHLHGEQTLSSSGSLVVEGVTVLNGNTTLGDAT
jgi:hypothetical protein